ncbi:Hypothetical protein SRAE_2000500000 [Strongyloides ratti]|uniref:Uncharacterized protein n=1 Tax=Strongyloides ratti TaxID=34506 RepID=A0A090N0A9_STRRB|nr:Hypothetical protein SRAE_2000500000 [Strongyloides ratti]CEF70367.2 Hypothetical protein SRAE_2000500000 [Strongyloides ratti]
MKLLILLPFPLFILVITIISVNSATQPLIIIKKEWTPMKAPLNGTMVQRLGRQGVEYYNKQNSNVTLTYINVTAGEKSGKKKEGNKKIRLTILVAKTSSDKKIENNNSCGKLRAVFNVTKEGQKNIIRVNLLETKVAGNCDIKSKDKKPQNTIKNKDSKGKKN